MKASRSIEASLLSLGLVITPVAATTTVKLKKSFIEENKDRATLTASFVVDKAHDNPKPAKEDGDIHVSEHADPTKY